MTRGDELRVKDAVLKDPVLVAHYSWDRQLKMTQTASPILKTLIYLRNMEPMTFDTNTDLKSSGF